VAFSKRACSLMVSLSNHEHAGSSFRLRQGCGGPPTREARRLVDALRMSGTLAAARGELVEPRAAAITVALVLFFTAPLYGSLTEGFRLAAIYDTILDAEFDRAAAQLDAACPPAPAGACAALRVGSIWWRILMDPANHALDRSFESQAQAAIALNTEWTRREPQRAEAWFYLAGSYAPLVQWRVLRGHRLAAARDGATIKSALERSLQLDPSLADAHFGIGLYHYYADVAPAYAKLLRWMLLLPGGDRRKGLEEMQEARQHGELLRDEADFQLQQLYVWYEHRASDAVALLRALDAKHPHNPVFLQRVADVLETSLHDRDACATAWIALRDRARAGRVFDARAIDARATEKLRTLRKLF
jgi:hypothetical protein